MPPPSKQRSRSSGTVSDRGATGAIFASHCGCDVHVAGRRALLEAGACAAIATMIGSGCTAHVAAADPPAHSFASGPEAAPTQELIEVWVVLSEPALASLPRDALQQRTALRERIVRQQQEIMPQLAELGAIEIGRTQQVSNALAVRLPRAAVTSVKKIDGVIAIRPVSHRNRIGA